MARGEFEDLPGKGKPIDLEAYFNTPEDLRMAFSLLKANEFVPHEVEIMREIGALKERLDASRDEAEQRELGRKIDEKRLTLNLLMDNRRRRQK